MAFNASHWIDYDACHTVLLCLLLWFFGPRCGPHAVSNRAGDSMNDSRSRYSRCDPDADLLGTDVCPESRNVRQPLVERRLGLPEVVPATADAAVPGLHRPARAIVESHGRAVERCFRAFAPHLVEAPPPAIALVPPLLWVASSIIMRPPLALVVDDPPIGKQRTVVLIHRRQLAECEVVHQHRGRVRRILRAAAQVDDLGLRHRLRNPYRSCRIRGPRPQPAIPGARSSRDRCRCVRTNFLRD